MHENLSAQTPLRLRDPPVFHTEMLAVMYFSVLFGFLAAYVNCDLQRILRDTPVAVHVLGFSLMAFLYVTMHPEMSITESAARALGMYVAYVFVTKSKWYFAVGTLSLLLVYLATETSFARASEREEAKSMEKEEEEEEQQGKHSVKEIVLLTLRILIIVTILAGVVHYAILQKREYGPRFSLRKFLLGTGVCKYREPKY